MKTYLECIPCFFRQALEATRMAGASEKVQEKVLIELSKALPKFCLKSSPPEMARILNILIRKITKIKDVYEPIKRKSNKMALKAYPRLKRKVAHSHDQLLMAVELAIAGNIIDYGAKNSLNVDEELKRILSEEARAIKKENKKFFDYAKFKGALKRAKTILYLADNAGETVFDRVLIEEIRKLDNSKEIIYAVKGKPAINDALIKDALDCGLDRVARVVSSGSDAPGTVLSLCSNKFLALYRKADMIISKGQGNFEALSRSKQPVFFLFMAKCPVIARAVGCKVGDVILRYYPGKTRK